MLTIRRTLANEATDNPAALLRRDLLACHERIRRFTEVAGRIARAIDPSPADVQEAARALVDYFGRALPLHVLDEEESLGPRLLALRSDDSRLAVAVSRMSSEHGPLEALVRLGVERWRRLVDIPLSLPPMQKELAEIAAQLELGFHEHLAGEETEIFPALVLLDEDSVVCIRREMRQRRVTPTR
jgi:iron-sulfur cluster repair protein YtfE (RIC family)